MKILVVSLLRLGDIIQQEPLLRGLRQKYPEAEIHLLLNKQFASIGKLLADVVDQFIEFDRESLQKGLGEANCNILWSYSRLEELVNSLNTQGYDQIFNFTHNKLSAYLIGALQAPQKNGLYHQNEKFCGLENRWLRYFNDRFSGTQKSLFHYVELLSGSFGIPAVSKTSHEKIKSKWILLQPLTSDVKKNWGLRNFLELKKTIETVLVDYRVGVLGAPFEREQLSKVFSDNDLVICDLVEVQEHLRKTALLISGDTSIKHLAASMGTPLVEIVIGSSDSGKTGALSENVRRVQTTVNCAPCSHSQPCHQKSHLCAEEIQIDQVFAKVWEQLSNEPRSLQWETRDLERAVWSAYLDQSSLEMATVKKFTNQPKTFEQVQKQGQILTTWLERAERALPAREVFLKKRSLHSSEMSELILVGQDILRSKQDEWGYFQNFLESLTARFAHPVQLFDRVHRALQEIREILEIRNQFVHAIESLSKEGDYYARGIGHLSISGFEETRASLQRTDEHSALQPRGRETETLG